jgi:HEPN domain-containing protein
MIAPAAVNAAFALELYLKCMQCIENGSFIKGHDLAKLYSAISRANRTRIEEYSKAHDANSPSHQRVKKKFSHLTRFDIQSVLTFSAKAFEIFRYEFEGPQRTAHGFVAHHVTKAVRQLILEIKPEWTPTD